MMTDTDGDIELAVRVDGVGLRRFYANVRAALLERGYSLTDAVAVLRVLERLVQVSIDRGAKRLQLRLHVTASSARLEVIDRRRPNPRVSLPADVVGPEVARSSGASHAAGGGGVVLWAIVDRVPGTDEPPAA